MTHPLTPREKVEEIVRTGMNRLAASQAGARPVVSASKEADRVTDAVLTALASGSGDHAELARAIERLLPIGINDTPDYAEVSFGECRAQAMTMEPETWLALNQLPALLAENAALRANEKAAMKECAEWARKAGEAIGKLETSEAAGIVEGWQTRATEAERKLAEAVGLLGDVVFVRRDNAGQSAEYMLSEVITKARTFLSKEAERG